MADIVAPDVRSRMMSGIRSKHTKPEMIVRRRLFEKGYRYRLHKKGLPGKPDLVFKSRHAVIFVHGCFWHGHGCKLFKWPASRSEFWRKKIHGNQTNDEKIKNALINRGWRILTIWECALRGKPDSQIANIIDTIANWLENSAGDMELRGDHYAGTK